MPRGSNGAAGAGQSQSAEGHADQPEHKCRGTADHSITGAGTSGGNSEIPQLTRFVSGMFDAMRKWLRSELLGRK